MADLRDVDVEVSHAAAAAAAAEDGDGNRSGGDKEERPQWGSTAEFILAAVGSAVGLGNLLRFPYMVFSHGGAAFLVPYALAVLLLGIPILARGPSSIHTQHVFAFALNLRLHRGSEYVFLTDRQR